MSAVSIAPPLKHVFYSKIMDDLFSPRLSVDLMIILLFAEKTSETEPTAADSLLESPDTHTCNNVL